MERTDDPEKALLNLIINLQTELTSHNHKNLSAIVFGQPKASGRWRRVEIQLENDDDDIIFERVYPDFPSYRDIQDDYGPLMSPE